MHVTQDEPAEDEENIHAVKAVSRKPCEKRVVSLQELAMREINPHRRDAANGSKGFNFLRGLRLCASHALYRRQMLETLIHNPLRLAHLHLFHAAGGRAFVADGNQHLYFFHLPRHQRLDSAVLAVAHEAVEAKLACMPVHECAEPHALNAAMDGESASSSHSGVWWTVNDG